MGLKKIMVVGSSNTDMVIQASRFPLPGETLMGNNFLMNAGGKGANQAMAAKRLGGDVMFVGRIGNDIFGQQSIALMKETGIDLEHLFVDTQTPSGVALITVNGQGENTIIVAPGSNEKLSPKDLDEAKIDYANVAIVLIQLEIALSTVIHVVEIAKRNSKKVVLNPAPAKDLPDHIFKGLYAITPNETEVETLTGIHVNDEVSAKKAALVLRQKGVQVIIITMGAAGAFVLSDNFMGMVKAPMVEVKDTTAAGDTFNGALSVAISEGKTIFQSVEFACKSAALSVTKVGAQTSIPMRDDLLKFDLLTEL